MSNKWTSLVLLTFAHFINDFFQFIIPLFLPLFVAEFGLSYLESGLLLAIYLGFGVALSPVVGHIADRYKKRKLVMCLGLVIYGVSVSSLQFAQSYLTLVLVAIAMGVGFSSYHPQAANVINSIYSNRRGRIMGLHGIGGSLGFFATPAILGPLAYTMGWRYAVSFLFIPAFAAALLLWAFFKEPEIVVVKTRQKMAWRPILILTAVYGLGVFVFRGFTNFLPAFLLASGDTAIEMSLQTALVLGTGIIAEPLGGALYDKIGHKKTFAISVSLFTLTLFLFMNTGGLAAILFLILAGFWGQDTRPVGLASACDMGPAESAGMRAGIVFGGAQAMSLASTIVVGYLADLTGFYWAYMALVAVACAAAALTFLIPKTSQNVGPAK